MLLYAISIIVGVSLPEIGTSDRDLCLGYRFMGYVDEATTRKIEIYQKKKCKDCEKSILVHVLVKNEKVGLVMIVNIDKESVEKNIKADKQCTRTKENIYQCTNGEKITLLHLCNNSIMEYKNDDKEIADFAKLSCISF